MTGLAPYTWNTGCNTTGSAEFLPQHLRTKAGLIWLWPNDSRAHSTPL
jgi:hypothetical protein